MRGSSARFSSLLAACAALSCSEGADDGVPNAAAGAGSQAMGPQPAPTSPPVVATPAPSASGTSVSPSGSGGQPPTDMEALGGSNGGTGPLPAPVDSPAIPSGGPPGTLLLSDDFEDGDTSGWIVDTADGAERADGWAIVTTDEGSAYAQSDDSSDDDTWSIGGSVYWTDVEVSTRFRFTAADEIADAVAMLALRFRSREAYYYIEYRGDGSLKLRKRFDGSDTDLLSEEVERVAVVGEWLDIAVSARGGAFRVTLDGVAVGAEVVDGDIPAGGIGLGVSESAAVEFDDVRVSVP